MHWAEFHHNYNHNGLCTTELGAGGRTPRPMHSVLAVVFGILSLLNNFTAIIIITTIFVLRNICASGGSCPCKKNEKRSNYYNLPILGFAIMECTLYLR